VSRTQVCDAARRQVTIRPVTIRQACATDRPALRDFLTGLSSRSRYLRFFSGASPGGAMLRILAGGADYVDALVATEDDVIIGHAMAADACGPGGAHVTEIGVVVAEARRGLGLGSSLVRLLTARAQDRGATALVMEVLAENRQVLTMIADHWPAAGYDRSGVAITVRARLDQPGPPPLPAVFGLAAMRPGE
jgi:GNAT superfamily N-acetyltransferase